MFRLINFISKNMTLLETLGLMDYPNELVRFDVNRLFFSMEDSKLLIHELT